MNIFKILSRGDGTIQEPNITSVLSYLLDPAEDHGMSGDFMLEFLNILEAEMLKKETFDFANARTRIMTLLSNSNSGLSTFIEIEKKLKDENKETNAKKNRDLDVFIEFRYLNEVVLRIIIEIKLYEEALTENQLSDIVKLSSLDSEPEKNFYLLISPYSSKLEKDTFNSSVFSHVTWKRISEELIEPFLKKEGAGRISPMNNQTKDLLKSFNVFIKDGFRNKINENLRIVKATVQINEKSLEFKRGILKYMISILKEIMLEYSLEVRREKLIDLHRIHKNFSRFALNLSEVINIVRERQNKGLGAEDFLKRRKYLDLKTMKLSNDKNFASVSEKYFKGNYLSVSTQLSASGKNNELLFFLEGLKQVFPDTNIKIEFEARIYFDTGENDYYIESRKY